jgi:putative endonuclease
LPRSSSKRLCERSSHYSATIVRTGTIRRPRTVRSIRNAWRLPSFATLAGSIRGIKKLSEFALSEFTLRADAVGPKGRRAMNVSGKPWFCYMVRCADDSLYIGVATEVEERVKEHNWGVGAAFTAKRRPVVLVWWEVFEDQKSARGREVELKGWRRAKKLRLVADWQREISSFALNCGLRMNFRAAGPKIQGSRFNGRPSVSKTESGGSNPSSPASSLGERPGARRLDAERMMGRASDSSGRRRAFRWHRRQK